MAEQQNETQTGAKASDATKEPASKYPVSRLIEYADRFIGHPSHVAAGAFDGENPEKEFTVDAAKARVEKWLNSPVD